MIKNKRGKIFSGFTLVELIIVITILAILATIAFISFQNYIKESKNTSKISTLKTIETGLQLYETKVGKYPHPDGEVITGKLGENTLTYLGYVKENLSHTLRFPKVVKDVTFDAYYPYGVSHTYDEYQVGAVLEGGQVYQNILPTSYAGNYYTKVNGQYKGYLLYMSGGTLMIANIPSLLYSISGATLPPEDYQLDSAETYYIINNGKNLPYAPNGYTETQNKTLPEILQEKTGKTDAEFVNISLETLKTAASSGQLSGFGVETLEQFKNLVEGAVKISSPSSGDSSGQDIIISCNGGTTLGNHQVYFNNQNTYSFTGKTNISYIVSFASSPQENTCQWKCGLGYKQVGGDCVVGTIPPSNLVLSHVSGSKNFSFSWTAGEGNGGLCKLQYNKNETWIDVSQQTYNCDADINNQNVTLPIDGWIGAGWNNISIRILRTSDTNIIGTFTQKLLCTLTSGSDTPTPLIDEDCDGYWDNQSEWKAIYLGINTTYTYGGGLPDSDLYGCGKTIGECKAWGKNTGRKYISLTQQTNGYVNCCYGNITGQTYTNSVISSSESYELQSGDKYY